MFLGKGGRLEKDKKKCWYCEEFLDVSEEFFGDVFCRKCGIQNSFLDPALLVRGEEKEGEKNG
jgi:hypothetical protein